MITDPIPRAQKEVTTDPTSKFQARSEPIISIAEKSRRNSAPALSLWRFTGPSVCGWLALLVFVSLLPCSAQTNTNAPTPLVNRYLLILNTSHSMQRRSDGTLRALQQLLGSGMGGQFRRGDELAIWTYNDRLDGGQFPLQRWWPETHAKVVARALAFVQQQRYQKTASLAQVMPPLNQLIKSSAFLTVVLVSDGEEQIHGTPFDEQINQSYVAWQEEQQKARMPLLTLLRAKGGVLTDFSVTPAPWPIDLPPLPKELQLADARQKKTPTLPPPPKKPLIGQSLFLHGKKETNAPPPAAITTTAGASSNAPTIPSIPVSTQLATPNPDSLSAPQTAAGITGLTSGSPQPAGPPAGVTAIPASTLEARPPAPTANAGPRPSSNSSAESPGTPPALTTIASSNLSGRARPDGIASAIATQGPAAAATRSTQNLILSNSTPASRTDSLAATTGPGNDGSKPNLRSPARSSSSNGSSTPGELALAPRPFFGGKLFWAAAGALLTALLLLLIVWLRRGHVPRRVSLITRSLEREKP
jgi:hypothetical protein